MLGVQDLSANLLVPVARQLRSEPRILAQIQLLGWIEATAVTVQKQEWSSYMVYIYNVYIYIFNYISLRYYIIYIHIQIRLQMIAVHTFQRVCVQQKVTKSNLLIYLLVFVPLSCAKNKHVETGTRNHNSIFTYLIHDDIGFSGTNIIDARKLIPALYSERSQTNWTNILGLRQSMTGF